MTLSVTSPHTRGAAVRRAQKRLSGDNVLKADYLRSPVDAEFGAATGRACVRAKFWLGYPSSELKPVYGSLLDSLLAGKPLPATYRARRIVRLRKAKETPLREKALTQARKYMGQKESPAGSNRIAFASIWYGVIGPWCAMAVTRWYVDAGSKAFQKGHRYAYVPNIVHDARNGENGLQLVTKPLPGDVVCYDWDKDGVADHVGLVHSPPAAGEFTAIEGNTSIGNNSNGGQVMLRGRNTGDVIAFVRVGR